MRFTDLHLLSADLAGTAAFYRQGLQLPLLNQTTTAVSFRIGYSTLTFHAVPGPRKPFYHVAFSVPFAQVDACCAWLKTRVEILPFSPSSVVADFPNWQARAVYFHDNNGNILECIGRDVRPGAGPPTFTPASLLGVNEVGLPLHNLTQDSEVLAASHGVPFFARGPKTSDFAPMGDDEGLFIASAIGRGWVPTFRPAERHWLKVGFEQQGRARELELT